MQKNWRQYGEGGKNRWPGGAVKQKKNQKMKSSLIHVTLLNF